MYCSSAFSNGVINGVTVIFVSISHNRLFRRCLLVMGFVTVSCDVGDADCEVCEDVPELSDSDEEQWQSMEEGSEHITVQCLLCDR